MNEVIELPRREIVVIEARRLEIIEIARQGERGRSAYEIWLAAGNVGSEEDFLQSLGGGTAWAKEDW